MHNLYLLLYLNGLGITPFTQLFFSTYIKVFLKGKKKKKAELKIKMKSSQVKLGLYK